MGMGAEAKDVPEAAALFEKAKEILGCARSTWSTFFFFDLSLINCQMESPPILIASSEMDFDRKLCIVAEEKADISPEANLLPFAAQAVLG